jgi:hypothetical protein
MLPFFQWLEATYTSMIESSFASSIHLSVWLFALTEAAHLLALASLAAPCWLWTCAFSDWV